MHEANKMLCCEVNRVIKEGDAFDMENGVSLADIRREAKLKTNCATYGIEYIVPTTPLPLESSKSSVSFS